MAGRYAEFAGGVLSPEADIILLTDEGQELEAKNRLARIGFDNVVASIDSTTQTMDEESVPSTKAKRVDVPGLVELQQAFPDLQLVDVRQPGETADGVIENAFCIPLTRLTEQFRSLDPTKPTAVYCAGGFRSSIAASLLRANGFADVCDLLGGYGAWSRTHATA